jgi:RNA polymerase sigma-32 factor
MGYRGYGLPISEVISEGNVGLMQAVKRFEPDKGFRLATYAMWWIKAAIQEYILRSWSLVKMGTTANQKKLFFNLRKAKSRISALEEGDLRPDQVKVIAKRLGVTEQDVVDMNRRLGGDVSLNSPIREEGDSGEWQDWLVDDSASQETRLAESEESDNRRKALGEALTVLNERERRIFEARRLVDQPITLEDLADELGVSRERVRQIEVRAFDKVQKAVKSRVAAVQVRQVRGRPNMRPFCQVSSTQVSSTQVASTHGKQRTLADDRVNQSGGTQSRASACPDRSDAAASCIAGTVAAPTDAAQVLRARAADAGHCDVADHCRRRVRTLLLDGGAFP